MKAILEKIFLSFFCLLMCACEETSTYAPVTDISTFESMPKKGIHQVRQGETLYAIAWRYGLDYRYLAKRNQINPPYTILLGQNIYLNEKPILIKQQTQKPASVPTITTAITPSITHDNQIERNYSPTKWFWPAKGKVINPFSLSNKGINIGGKIGESIHAVAAGKVVYCGNGLRGYGNLVILKHNSLYLSAYAHNNIVLVKEGEWVHQGQKIAEMGHTGSDKVMLHFEIRRAGKPVDPLNLLNG